ncbi:MAG TPA: RelA/SpoT domain-containing protein [Candidatus Limnocylindria bacterium]
MGLGLSPSSVDALGRRIAKGSPSAADLATLSAIQRERAGALDAVSDVLRRAFGTPPRSGRATLAITSRVKTPTALIEALRRRSSLSTVEDIVGIRIVGAMNLKEQDALTAKVLELLPDSTVVDHRRRPAQGYRAVHVVARYSGVPVELQIRTRAQHAWAEATERLADRWGRGILHGVAHKGRGAAETATRSEALAKWELAAARIAKLEQETMRLTDVLSARIQAAVQADPLVKPQDAAARLIQEDPSLTGGINAAALAIGAALREAGAEIVPLIDGARSVASGR